MITKTHNLTQERKGKRQEFWPKQISKSKFHFQLRLKRTKKRLRENHRKIKITPIKIKIKTIDCYEENKLNWKNLKQNQKHGVCKSIRRKYMISRNSQRSNKNKKKLDSGFPVSQGCSVHLHAAVLYYHRNWLHKVPNRTIRKKNKYPTVLQISVLGHKQAQCIQFPWFNRIMFEIPFSRHENIKAMTRSSYWTLNQGQRSLTSNTVFSKEIKGIHNFISK